MGGVDLAARTSQERDAMLSVEQDTVLPRNHLNTRQDAVNCAKCGDRRLNGIVSRSVIVSVTYCGGIDSSHTEIPWSSLFMQVKYYLGNRSF